METLNQSQEIFKRVETKYLLSTDQYRFVSGRMGQYMEVDQYGKDTINSIYFDTPDYQMIRRSLEKPLYKEKLRLRTYGQGACQGDPSKIVYAEIKKKYKGIVYKRRQPSGSTGWDPGRWTRRSPGRSTICWSSTVRSRPCI